MKLIILFLFVFLTVDSAPTVFNLNQIKEEGEALVIEDLEIFKSQAENNESIKEYVNKLKDYLLKAVENRIQINDEVKFLEDYIDSLVSAQDGYFDSKEHERFDSKLQDLIAISKVIVNHGIDWIKERIVSVKNEGSRITLKDIKKSLKMERIALINVSSLGSQLKDIMSGTYESILGSVGTLNDIKSRLNYVLMTSYINAAVTKIGYIEENDSEDDEDELIVLI